MFFCIALQKGSIEHGRREPPFAAPLNVKAHRSYRHISRSYLRLQPTIMQYVHIYAHKCTMLHCLNKTHHIQRCHENTEFLQPTAYKRFEVFRSLYFDIEILLDIKDIYTFLEYRVPQHTNEQKILEIFAHF